MRTAILGVILILAAVPANADVDVHPGREGSSIVVDATDEVRPSARGGTPKPVGSKKAPPKFMSCDVSGSSASCGSSFSTLPGQPDADNPELTVGDILRAVRELGLPSLKVRIQPGEETLVNIETIFYTQPQPFERSIALLGFDIDLSAEPVRYTWVHDDGTASTTSRPGKPYPAMDVTHRYREPADDVHPRVDVTYRVRYRVDGGAWQTIGQTLQASGPAAELDVREAAPVLTKP
jgi:hypothetical protein